MIRFKGNLIGKCIVFILLIGLASSLYSNQLAKIYTYDDPLYHQLERISIESGIAPPSSASPWSGYELLDHLKKIEPSQLSTVGKNLFHEIKEQLTGSDEVYYEVKGIISPEIHIHLNDQVGPFDWVRDHHSRSSMGILEAEAVLGNHVYGLFTIEGLNRLSHAYPQQGEKNLGFAQLSTNLVLGDKKFDDSVPHTAFIGYATENSTFSIGRKTQSWGRGTSGNLFIGNHAPFHDYITFTAFHDNIAYRFAAMQFNSLDDSGNAQETSFSEGIRLFVAHRTDLRLHPRLLLSITEGAMFHTKHMDLRMFSPLMFLHNYYNFSEAKNAIQFDVEYLITPGLYAYSQLFIDQFQTKGEVAGYSECNLFPNAFGVLLGLQFSKSTDNGYLSGYAESVFTSTYLYLRRNIPSDDEEMEQECQDAMYYTDHYNLDYVQSFTRQGVSFLGFKYGPDTIFNTLHISYEQYRSYRLFGELMFSIRGNQGLEQEEKQQVVDTGKLYVNQLLPSGIKEYTLISGFGGDLHITTLPIMLYGQIHGIHTWNYQNTEQQYFFDVQLHIGARMELTSL